LIEDIVFDPFRSPFPSGHAGPVEPPATETAPTAPAPSPSLPAAVRRLEIDMLEGALQRTGHNQKKAAALLGLSYHQFRGLFRKHAESLKARLTAETAGDTLASAEPKEVRE
jgi:psp operon transcriptional activator